MNTSPLSNLILRGHFVAKGTRSHANWFSESMKLQQVFIKCLKPGPRKRYQDASGRVLFHSFITMFSAFILVLYRLNSVGEEMHNKEV